MKRGNKYKPLNLRDSLHQTWDSGRYWGHNIYILYAWALVYQSPLDDMVRKRRWFNNAVKGGIVFG